MKPILAVLAQLLLFVSALTLIFAVVAYLAFKFRQRSRQLRTSPKSPKSAPLRVLELYEAPDDENKG